MLLLLWIYDFSSMGSLSLASSLENGPSVFALLGHNRDAKSSCFCSENLPSTYFHIRSGSQFFIPSGFKTFTSLSILSSIGYSAVSINQFSSVCFHPSFFLDWRVRFFFFFARYFQLSQHNHYFPSPVLRSFEDCSTGGTLEVEECWRGTVDSCSLHTILLSF